MSAEELLRPGDVMIGPIGGFVPGLIPISFGQTALAISRRRWTKILSWKLWRRYRHAAIIGSLPAPDMPRLTVIQAMPSGAEEVWLDEAKHLTGKYIYIRPASMHAMRGNAEEMMHAADWLDQFPQRLVSCARAYIGRPYNFLTYAKLAAGVLRSRATEELLRRWISTRRDMMCSQLVDQALADAGYHLFDDGRLPQDVVPAELFLSLIARPGSFLIPGHATYGQWTDNRLHPLHADAKRGVR